jgi:hypothetical protein
MLLVVTFLPLTSVLAQERYWSATHLFVITPPSGWTVSEKSPDEVQFEFKLDGTLVAALGVLVGASPDADLTMRELISALKQEYAKSFKDFRVTHEGDVKVAGVDGYELGFTDRSMQVRAKQIILLRGDKLYSILYMTSERDYGWYLAEADKSINSFRFTQKLSFDADPKIASITVDQKTYSPEDLPKIMFFVVGETHSMTIQPTIPGDIGTRYVFLEWSDGKKETSRSVTITKSETYTAKYKTQYELIVRSEYGMAQGAGWYDAESEASFSVTTPPMPESGFMGTLGARIIFDRWSGDSSASTPTATIKMDGPKVVTATWKTDYTQPYIILGAIAAVVVLAILGLVAVMRRKAAPPTPPAPRAAAMKYCVQCGTQIPSEAMHCPRCGAEQ